MAQISVAESYYGAWHRPLRRLRYQAKVGHVARGLGDCHLALPLDDDFVMLLHSTGGSN